MQTANRINSVQWCWNEHASDALDGSRLLPVGLTYGVFTGYRYDFQAHSLK